MSVSKRKPIISGNWKMNQNHFEAIQLVQKLAYLLSKEDFEAVDVTLHPPFTDLRSVQTLIDADQLKMVLGAQHCHWEEKGAYTGEISPAFLSKLNVHYVIAGHSERRELFGESDEDVAKKIAAIVKFGMTPIICCGETLAEREAGGTLEKVLGQIRSALSGFKAGQVENFVIAYEPIWAIGTGKTATAADAQEVCSAIRGEITKLFNQGVSDLVRIQYGGSVKAGNIAELMKMKDIDGALVGGASLEADEFARIVQFRLHGN
jgi:triosephosphate isomerase (TIM)